MTTVPLLYADDVETIPADEAREIQQIMQALELVLIRSRVKSDQFRPDVHVKTHGYARGEFRILPDLPDELAQGLFEHPASHEAVVRFSNAASQPQPDAIPDGRGLAVKVLGIPGDPLMVDEQSGPAQDFVMINHPVFFARNVKDYLRIEQVILQSGDSAFAKLQEGLTGGNWNPLNWHWREMLAVARIAGQFPDHPASQTYFSMAPIRFGRYVAKYRVLPASGPPDCYLDLLRRLGTQADAMRLALEETLRTQSLEFDFQVQLRTSSDSMPVEDATIEWPEGESPFRTVARLVLPRQEIEPLRLQPAYRDLAFNVWHALAAHRPLGGINRVRRWAYALSAAWRRQAGEGSAGQ